MSKVWKLFGVFSFTVVGANIFLIEFAEESDRDKKNCKVVHGFLIDSYSVLRILIA